jgi:cytosine/adenosine deaminase-related metal-dependent hydrolase
LTFITATQIHSGKSWLPEGTVLEISDGGRIENIHPGATIPPENIKRYEGILCPGFVNAHGHLELSHLKGQIAEGGGLVDFIRAVMALRSSFSAEEKEAAIGAALAEMKEKGIVAIGDIANSPDTLGFRRGAGMHIHTFIEALGFTEEKAADRFSFSEQLYQRFAAQEADFILRQSIGPHAPYSISEKLFSLLNAYGAGQTLSIHSQETAAENEWYERKAGGLQHFYEALSIDTGFFRPSGKTSLQTWLPWLDRPARLILVHNTFISEADIAFLGRPEQDIFLCLCPRANLYIERRLPPVALLDASGLDICLGTDSLASNHSLSILSEMQQLYQHFPDISIEKLIRWATWNGARALDMEGRIGSFSEGRKPGILLMDEALDKVEVIA